MEDLLIVQLYLQRNEAALAHTAEKYGSRLRNLAYTITEDRLSAEECENDTYLQAWNSIPPHEPVNYLYAFLARITRHISLNICRERSALKRSGHILSLTDELSQCLPAVNDVHRQLEEKALLETIHAFLAGQKEEKRNIFLRRYWFLDSVEQISQRFSISQSKVKTSLHRSRAELRKFLEKEGYTL